MSVGWIWTVNLRPFLEVLSSEVGCVFDASDWTAVESGLIGTDSERGPRFDYPVGGLSVSVSFEPGANEMVSIRIDGDIAATGPKIHWLADFLRSYEVQPRGGGGTAA